MYNFGTFLLVCCNRGNTHSDNKNYQNEYRLALGFGGVCTSLLRIHVLFMSFLSNFLSNTVTHARSIEIFVILVVSVDN